MAKNSGWQSMSVKNDDCKAWIGVTKDDGMVKLLIDTQCAYLTDKEVDELVNYSAIELPSLM